MPLLQVFSPEPATQTIDEGETATVNIGTLCADGTGDVTVDIDWGDTNTETRTFTVDTNNADDGSICGTAGWYIVCDETGSITEDPQCDGWTNTYTDNPSVGTDYTVAMSAEQTGTDTQTQNLTVTVNNLPPNVIALTRTGANIEGINGVFDLTVEDPGLEADEIDGVTWTWTPTDGVNDPTVVNCTCGNATDCDDGTNLAICGETDGPETDQKSRRYLDDGSYTLEVVVTDKDGAQTTDTVVTSINNQPPGSLGIDIDDTAISGNSANPTELIEGTSYNFVGSFVEPGIDQLDILWTLGDGAFKPTSGTPGFGEVLKGATYPNVQNLNPADLLDFDYTYDNTASSLSDDYIVSLDVDDDDSGSAILEGYVRVVDVNPVINAFTANSTSADATVTEGESVTFAVAAVSGAEDSTFDPIDTYTWDIDGNGNGSLADEYTVDAGCGTTDTTCTVTFLDDDPDGSYDVNVTVNDEDSSTSTSDEGLTRTVTVDNDDVTLNPIGTLNAIDEGGTARVTFTFSDQAGALDGDYDVAVTWGDGTSDTTASFATPGTYTLPDTNVAAHTYADDELCSGGVCTVTVEVCEVGGTICDVQTTTITVSNTDPIPSIASFPVLEEGYYFDLDGSWTDRGMSSDDTYNWIWTGMDNDGATELEGTGVYANRTTAADVTAIAGSEGGFFDSIDTGTTEQRTITLTVSDDDGGSGSTQITANVADNTPEITSIVDDFVPSGQDDEPALGTIDVTVAAETDADLVERIVVNWGDPNIADTDIDASDSTFGTQFPVDSAGDTFSITAPSEYIESGTYTITVTVYDEDSNASDSIDVNVINVAPTIDTVETNPAQPVIVTEGQSLSVRITASDPSTVDAQSLDFDIDWDDGASDFAVGSGTGTATEARARFTHVYTDPGNYTVTITVTDPDGDSDTETLDVEVLNRAPAITDVFNTGPVDENTEVTAVMLVDNPGADELSYSFNFGCTTTVAANVSDADFSDAAPGTGTSAVESNTYEDEGSYPVCVRVCDDDGPNFGCDYGLTTVQVDNVAPVLSAVTSNGPVSEDSAGADVTVTATATDVGSNDTLTYSFDCDSDGSEDANNTTGSATCTYMDSGIYTATVTVTDGDGGSDFGTAQIRIINSDPVIDSVSATDVDEGNATTVTITASDDGPDTHVFRWDFDNDGTYDVQKSSGTASWTYPTDGSKTVAVQVCDDEGACDEDSTTLLVSNVAPVIASVSVPSSVSRGTAVTAIADATDAGGDALSYVFDFKDSSGTSVAAIGPQASNVATATFDQSGSYTVEVTVTDTANAPNSPATDTDTASFTVTDISVAVSAVANPSTITEGGSTTITVTPSGTGPYLVRYDINGDGDFNDTEDIVPADANDTCDPCSESGITYTDNRPGNLPYRVLVEVTDTGEGNTVATALVSVTVNNAPPQIDAISDVTVDEQTAVSLDITATDAGADDTITYSLVSGPNGITVDANSGAFDWTPDWPDAGANSVTVRATDDDGDSTEETFTITVDIIDTNNNGVSDTRERELNNDQLLPADAGTTDSDNDGVSDLDEVLDGTDPNVSDAPSAPLILSPDGEPVDVLRPTLTVVNAESPRGLDLTYTFVVVDDQGATVTTIADVEEGVNTTSVDVDVDLTEDAVYTWYAFADDGLAQGEDSVEGEFNVNTTNSAPPVPEGLTPVDGATLPNGSLPGLELRAVVDPDGDDVWYEFELATDDQFTDVVLQSELRSVPFYSLPEVLEPGTYYWHGQATDGTDDSGFGTAFSFTIEEPTASNTAPSAPAIVGPDAEVLATDSATLEIEASTDPEGDTLEYEFELADNPAFAGAEQSGLQAGLTYDVSGLDEDTTYYWRARAYDGMITSDWSVASFMVDAENAAPTGLQLLSPANGALLENAPEAFVWFAATDADGDDLTYTVELATNADFENPLFTEEVTGDGEILEAAPTDVNFQPEFTYYWRVTVTDGTDSLTASSSFDLLAISTGGSGDEGGCCTTVHRSEEPKPWALLIGFVLAGLAVARRRRD